MTAMQDIELNASHTTEKPCGTVALEPAFRRARST